MTHILLGLGSNISRTETLSKALSLLAEKYGEIKISPTFESEAVGFDGDNFYNLVVAAETDQTLEDVIATYRQIEDVCGRVRTGPKFGPRKLDIDLLMYGDLVCQDPIELPRDEILINAYVLWPLALLEPDTKHPIAGLSYSELWLNYDNKQALWQIDVPWD